MKKTKSLLVRLIPYIIIGIGILLDFITGLRLLLSIKFNVLISIILFIFIYFEFTAKGKLFEKGITSFSKNKMHLKPIIEALGRTKFQGFIVLLAFLLMLSSSISGIRYYLSWKITDNIKITTPTEKQLDATYFVKGSSKIAIYNTLSPTIKLEIQNLSNFGDAFIDLYDENNASKYRYKLNKTKDGFFTWAPNKDLDINIYKADIITKDYNLKKPQTASFLFTPSLYDQFNNILNWVTLYKGRHEITDEGLLLSAMNYSVKPYILKYRYPIPKSVSIEIYCIFKYSSNLKLGGVGFHLPGGYAVIFRDGGHNKLTLRKGIESKEIPLKLNTCKPHFETDKYYKLRVDLNNFVIKLFVDDICVAETTTDNIPDDDNYIGFGVWNCDAIFKYIRITSPF